MKTFIIFIPVMLCTVAACSKRQQVQTPAAPSTAPQIVKPSTPSAPSAPKKRPSAAPPKLEPPPAQPQPAPLGELLTKAEREQYTREVDLLLHRSAQTLSGMRSKVLTPDQSTAVARVETFIRQAEIARKQNDLVDAKALAERADRLAADLARSNH